MKKHISLFALAAAIIAVPVLAAPDGGKMADANGDGVTTRAEAQTATAAHFAKMDVNKDGKLDATDRAAHRAERQGTMFGKLDTDSNGSISRTEWEAHSAARDAKHGEGHGKRADAGETGEHGMRGQHGGGMAMMMKADANGDKAISQAEFSTAALAMFDRADTNKDGQVSAAEHQAARQTMGAMHRPAAAPTGE